MNPVILQAEVMDGSVVLWWSDGSFDLIFIEEKETA